MYVERSKIKASSDSHTSGGEYVSEIAETGGDFTWCFYSDNTGGASVIFSLANADSERDISIGVRKLFACYLNGSEVTYTSVTGKASENGNAWVQIESNSIELKKGLNILTMSIAKDSPSFNFDYIAVQANSAKLSYHNHDYSRTFTAATCETDGVMNYHCTQCNVSYDTF